MQSFSSLSAICAQSTTGFISFLDNSVPGGSTDIELKSVLNLMWYLSAVYCFDSPVNCKNEYMMECMLNAGHV